MSDYFCVSASDFFIESRPENSEEDFLRRVSECSKLSKELPMKTLDSLTNEQVRELLDSGFRFKHKTLEQYIEESGGELIVSEELDWGEPVGREVW